MSIVFPYIKILRPLNLLFAAISVFITAYITDSITLYKSIIEAIIVVVAFAGASNILNDIIDINIDKINKPLRILPSEKISIRSAIIYMFFLYFIGIFVTLQLPELAEKIVFYFVLPTLILYTPFFKRMPIIGNMVIASILSMVFLFSEAVFNNSIEITIIPSVLAFGLSFIRELVKDIEDIEGDHINGANTFPVVFGIKNSIYLVNLLIIIFCLMSWVPFFTGFYDNTYAVPLFLIVQIPLIISIFFLRKNPTSSGCKIVSRVTKWITFSGMVTIVCSSL